MNNDNKALALESNGQIFTYEVIYYWYHHMTFSFGERELIHNAIQNGDFQTFKMYYLEYKDDYFPETASVYSGGRSIGSIEIDSPEGFALITFNECECG